jgi:hypothetical protein
VNWASGNLEGIYDPRVGDWAKTAIPEYGKHGSCTASSHPSHALGKQGDAVFSGLFRLAIAIFSLFVSARVVSRIDVGKLQRCHPVDLYHYRS